MREGTTALPPTLNANENERRTAISEVPTNVTHTPVPGVNGEDARDRESVNTQAGHRDRLLIEPAGPGAASTGRTASKRTSEQSHRTRLRAQAGDHAERPGCCGKATARREARGLPPSWRPRLVPRQAHSSGSRLLPGLVQGRTRRPETSSVYTESAARGATGGRVCRVTERVLPAVPRPPLRGPSRTQGGTVRACGRAQDKICALGLWPRTARGPRGEKNLENVSSVFASTGQTSSSVVAVCFEARAICVVPSEHPRGAGRLPHARPAL